MNRILAFLIAMLLSSTVAPIVSEIVADNDTGLQDEDDSFVDWVELHKPNDAPFDLKDHFLTDDPTGKPDRWTFPAISL
jgi:hypothetical protein